MSYQQQSNPNSPIPDSIWSPRGFIDASASSRSKFPHTQENPVNSTCLFQYRKITYHRIIMPHNHNQTTKSIIIQITCKKVSSNNKFVQCTQEWDATYTPSWSKIRLEVSQYISDEIMCITISQVCLSNKNGNYWRISYAFSQVAECGL
jgi:hypothetical protein